jgi:3-methyladenine DNA glycosylase AlkD
MLHQLGWRGETDADRLFAYAERLAPEPEFFIRKAIGWALRDYSRHDGASVEMFLRERKDLLSPLSFREAGKRLGEISPAEGTAVPEPM